MAELIKSITKKEWRLLGILALTVIVVTTIPLVYGWLVRPPGSIFVGIHFSNLNDWIVYYSYLEQARQGSLLFDNLFTAENQTPMFNIFWISVGILAKIFNLSPILTFNLVRILLIPIFYFVAYLFISYIFKDVRKRQVALLLLSFSAGLGFFLLGRIVEYPTNHALGQFNWPIDLWVPEAFTFLTLYYSPHFIASLTLILSVFFLSLIYVEKRQFFYSIWTGILALILFFFHPFHVLTVFGVIFFYFLILIIKNREQLWPLFRHYVVLLIFSAPAIYYYFYLLSTDFVGVLAAGLIMVNRICFFLPAWRDEFIQQYHDQTPLTCYSAGSCSVYPEQVGCAAPCVVKTPA